jgi:transposase
LKCADLAVGLLIEERTREAQRLHKIIEGSGIKLANVATDILGVSGRAMLNALIGGTHDPEILAELARGRLRKKLPALRKALSGWFSPTHRLLVGELLAHLEYIDEAIERLSNDVATMIAPSPGRLTSSTPSLGLIFGRQK